MRKHYLNNVQNYLEKKIRSGNYSIK